MSDATVEQETELTDVFVGGYWWSRGESPEEIGGRLHRWLGELVGMHDDFESWTVENRPAGDAAMLADLIRREFNRDEETGEPLEDLGFRVFGDNTPPGSPRAEFILDAGATASSMPNNVLLRSPYREPVPREWIGLAVPLIESLVTRWQPDVAMLTRTSYMMAAKTLSRDRFPPARSASSTGARCRRRDPRAVARRRHARLDLRGSLGRRPGADLPEVPRVKPLTRLPVGPQHLGSPGSVGGPSYGGARRTTNHHSRETPCGR